MASITLTKLCKSFGEIEVLINLDLSIADGEFVVLVGPSGCGKSTLLRLIAGLDDPTSGDILMDDHWVNNLTPRERNVAMVFQSYALYPHMTVAENIGFNLRISGLSKADIKQRVARAAQILDIGELLQRKPSQLSGGQRQRVAMGVLWCEILMFFCSMNPCLILMRYYAFKCVKKSNICISP